MKIVKTRYFYKRIEKAIKKVNNANISIKYFGNNILTFKSLAFHIIGEVRDYPSISVEDFIETPDIIIKELIRYKKNKNLSELKIFYSNSLFDYKWITTLKF